MEAARPLLCQQGRRRHLCDSGAGRKGLSSAPGWGWMGQGVSSACLHPAGHIHAAWLPCLLLSQHQNSSRKNQKKQKTNNPQVAEALEGSEGRAATCSSSQGPCSLPAAPAACTPLPARCRLPREAACPRAPRRSLPPPPRLCFLSSPLAAGASQLHAEPSPWGSPPGCWGGRRWEPLRPGARGLMRCWAMQLLCSGTGLPRQPVG